MSLLYTNKIELRNKLVFEPIFYLTLRLTCTSKQTNYPICLHLLYLKKKIATNL